MADIDLTARVLFAGQSVEVRGTVAGVANVIHEGTEAVGTFGSGDVDAGTDRITITGHGLVNGIKCYVTTTGTIPGGLTASAKVYAKRIDDNTIELYEEQDLTTIKNITSGGSGTHTLTKYHHLTLNVNGTAAQCSAVIRENANNINKYLHYIIPSGSRPAAGDTLTFDLAAGGVVDDGDSSPAYSGQACVNNVGTELMLTSLDDIEDRPLISAQVTTPVDWIGHEYLTNMGLQIRQWIRGSDDSYIGHDKLSAVGMPTDMDGESFLYSYGPYVSWDADGVDVQPAGQTMWLMWRDMTQEMGGTGTTDITVTGNLTAVGAKAWDATLKKWKLQVTLDGTETGTIRINNIGNGADIYEPLELLRDEDLNRTQFYSATTLGRLKPFKRVRFMNFQNTNGSSASSTSHITPASYIPARGRNERITATVSSIVEYAGADTAWDGQTGTVLHVTTTAAHGYVDGQKVAISGSDGTVNAVTMNGTTYTVRKLSATEFTTLHTSTGAVVNATTGSLEVEVEFQAAPEWLAWLMNEAEMDEGQLCIGRCWDDTCITDYLTRYKAALTGNPHTFLEYSNEVWNGGFKQAFQVVQVIQKNLGGFANGSLWFCDKVKAIYDLALPIFGAGNVTMVFAGQSANEWYVEQMIARYKAQSYDFPYEVQSAPYFTVPTNYYPELKMLDASGAIDILYSTIDTKMRGEVADTYAVANAEGVALAAYEGGQHLSPGTDSDLQAIMTPMQIHNRMLFVYWFWLKMCADEGMTSPNQFDLQARWSDGRDGYWGSYAYYNQIPGPTNPDPLTVSTARSVKAYACEQWNTEAASGGIGPTMMGRTARRRVSRRQRFV